MDTNEIAFRRIIDSIDGCVNAQGVKIKFPSWMVLGSENWESTPDQIKAYAYQAAKATGWTSKSLVKAACNVYQHIDKHMAEFTINLLEDLEKQYPLEVEMKMRELPKVILKEGKRSREL